MRSWVAALAVLMAACLSTPVKAQTVVYSCEHKSGAFVGQIWTVEVDFGSRRLTFVDDRPVIANISERYIQWTQPASSGGATRRIDRHTGQMTRWLPTAPYWDAVFGNPGVICARAGPPL